MCNIKRFDGETEEELLYRVGQRKEEIGTWEDIADLMNTLLGYDYGEAKYRKQYAIIKKIYDNSEPCSDEEYLNELQELKQELKSERIKIQTLNLERNRIDREGARQELFYEQIGQYIQSREVPKLEPKYLPRNKRMKYLLGIADIHANAYWKTATNEYSMEIVKDRLSLLLTETISFIREKQLDELNIILLGDLIDGCLRMSNLQAMDSTVSKSVSSSSDSINVSSDD